MLVTTTDRGLAVGKYSIINIADYVYTLLKVALETVTTCDQVCNHYLGRDCTSCNSNFHIIFLLHAGI